MAFNLQVAEQNDFADLLKVLCFLLVTMSCYFVFK